MVGGARGREMLQDGGGGGGGGVIGVGMLSDRVVRAGFPFSKGGRRVWLLPRPCCRQ